MYHRRPPKYRYICYSCVTGQPVWFYQGQSREGMLKAFRRAAKKEQTRARWFQRRTERRTRCIQHLLDECLAAIPILGKLTKEQREAVRRLKAIIAEKQERYSAFYYHIQNARRRRDRKSCRWHSKKRCEMEAQKKSHNRDYVK